MNVGPHPNTQSDTDTSSTGPEPWYMREPPYERLGDNPLARLQRWRERQREIAAGAPVLSRRQLGDLIIQTKATIEGATGPVDIAALNIALEDMYREYERATILEEDDTKWPDRSSAGPESEPAKM